MVTEVQFLKKPRAASFLQCPEILWFEDVKGHAAAQASPMNGTSLPVTAYCLPSVSTLEGSGVSKYGLMPGEWSPGVITTHETLSCELQYGTIILS